MKVGYARVSTQEQNLDLQIKALDQFGCDKVFKDKGISGTQRDRPQLKKALAALDDGDVLVVWKLDRLGRSLAHLIGLVSELKGRGVGFASVSEKIDTTSPGGKLFFHMMGALAEFERDLIVERTKAGMQAARRRGKHLGRPRKLDGDQLNHAKDLISQGRSRNEVARLLKVDPATLYRRLQEAKHVV
jgi:DNA invertase Pin-like site-specific DNA recombinase